jgi:amino acid adenylation domain-containing protein
MTESCKPNNCAVPGVAPAENTYPLSPLQEGLLFHRLLHERSDSYVLSLLFELSGDAQVAALLSALNKVIARHDVLRTAIQWKGVPRPMQTVHVQAVLPIERFDLDPEREVREQLHELMKAAHRVLDLQQAPLARLMVAKDPRGSSYYAVLQVHHLVCDHQSLNFIAEEAIACIEGRERELPATRPYRHYVEQALAGANTEEGRAFFLGRLADVEEPTAPFDLSDIHGDATRIEEVSRALDADLVQGVRACARLMGVSSARLVHAAWAVVVARTSARSDIVFGTVVLAARQRGMQKERMLGMSVNTLPLRLRLADATARSLVQQTHDELTEVLRHEHVPLTVSQACSGVPDQAPLFTSLLNYRHTAEEHRTASTDGVRVAGRGEAWSNYPLAMLVDDCGDEIMLTAQTNGRPEARRVIGYLETAIRSLLRALQSAPDTPALKLAILPEHEKRDVVTRFNSTHGGNPRGVSVHQLFERQVAGAPAATAVIHRDRHLSYSELNALANRLAHHLLSSGVECGEHIVVLMPRSIELVVAELAVLKAGCVYVPIDPEVPPSRLRFIIEDCGARRVLSTSGAMPGVFPEGVVCTDVRECETITGRLPGTNPSLQVSAEAAAYIMYTSGSTGTPKGVRIPHRAIHRLVIDNHYARIGQSDRIASCSNPAFDASTFEIWCALANGASVLVVDHDELLEPPRFAELLQQQHVTAMFMTVGLFNQCAVALAPVFRGLRYLLVGGDTLDSSIVGQVLASGPPQNLLNAYGPTETTTFATTHRISSEDVCCGRIPIGTPIADTRILILDESSEPVPIGVTGEIFIGGAGVALGYLNRPELNRQRFVADCVTGQAGLLYRTGDLGRWRADGAVEFLGRTDTQVKLRGFRIELGEIEVHLTQHPQIRNAAVVTRNDPAGEKRLVAYVVADDGDDRPDAEQLRLHLAERLPDYMIPAAIVFLDRLPLTPNGKLDRKSLPAPQGESYASEHYEAPRGEVEERLAEIWSSLLQVERVGRLDSFFRLGGHSLLVVRLIDRLRRVGLAVEARRVFATPTLCELARALQPDGFNHPVALPNRIDEGCREITPEMLPLVRLGPEHIERIVQRVPGGAANIQDIYPLAPLQEGILFHHLLSARNADAYVSSTLLSVSSRRRVEELVEALQGAVDRHDVLRTAIHWQHLPQPIQVVCRRAKVVVEELVLDADRDAREQVERWLEPARQRLDLRVPPLIRIGFARNPSSSQWYVLLQLHHMISDATSLHQVVSEVVAQMEGQAIHLPTSTPFRDHVAFALAQSRQYDAEAFFRQKLAGIDEWTAPFGLSDTRGDGTHIVEASEALGPELSREIRHAARRMGVSPATLLHAAWALVVAHTSGRDDVVFGSVLLGRFQGAAGVASCLGMFINTLPLRLRIGGLSAKDLVVMTNQELLDLLAHEHAPLAMAQRCAGLDPAMPLFTSLLNYRRDSSDPASQWSRAAGVSLLASRNLTNYPLALSVDDDGERFVLTVQTDRRVDPRRVTGYVRTALRSLVRALEEEPAAAALRLPILPEHEQHAVVAGFNGRSVPTEAAYLIHERFEAHARLTPCATAVTCEGQSLTYDELNRRANQLARHVRQFGAGPDRLVALCAERSLDLIVGVLGILKAGAAYVPLDPSHPSGRLAYMLQDAQPQVLVTEERLREKLTFSGPVVALDRDSNEIRKHADGDLDSRTIGLRPEHLAYVIYTSGSTGQPKGVMVEHRNVTRLFSSTDAQFGFGAADVWTLFHSIAFDFSVWEVWGALLYGGRLVVVPYATTRSPRDFYRLLCDEGVTVLNQTPSAFTQLIDAQGASALRHSLRLVIFGGEALELRTLHPWVERNGAQRPLLVNMYGITETTVHVTYLPLTLEQIGGERSSVIGGPIADLRVYLLNQHLQPVPIGVVGEMYVAGAGVARGYWRRPELTAQRFMTDPFCSDDSARMYRSGDLARRRADGTLEYLGRNDDQVKIRGFRIETGEIEAQLAAHPCVKEVTVVARTESTGDKRLVAYIVADGAAGEPRAAEQLRTYLRARLPDYMIPSAFVLLEQFPLTANGKLDRRALPAPGPNACNGHGDEPPQGGTEEALAAIWRELLQVDRVSREDNFFELGGHSLSAMQLIARIQSRLNIEAGMELLFASPSLRLLSERLDELPRTDPADTMTDSEADGLLAAVTSMSEAKAEAMLLQLRTER